MAATNAPRRYPALEGIRLREARLRAASAELCACERAALGKNSSAELLANTFLSERKANC